jgi:hypothetical protein
MRRTHSEQLNHGKQMEKWFGLQVCNVLVNHDIPYTIHHMKDDFCCVDFKLRHIKNKATLCFLELKSRNGISTYPSFRIGSDKMLQIHLTDKKPSYLVWYDENCGKIFYTKYRTEFIRFKKIYCRHAKNHYILIDRDDTIETTIEDMILTITT